MNAGYLFTVPYRLRRTRTWPTKAFHSLSRERQPMSSKWRRLEVLLPLRFNDEAGCASRMARGSGLGHRVPPRRQIAALSPRTNPLERAGALRLITLHP